MNLSDYGFKPDMTAGYADGTPARITAVHKERYTFVCEYGEGFARLKAREYYLLSEQFPTTGDFVLINYDKNGESRIFVTLPRRTFFSRRDPTPGRGEQAVAANFDYVFIMQSLNGDYNIKRLERYLTLALQSRAVPVVVLTKADLAGDYSRQVQQVSAIAPGIGVHAVSVISGVGIDALRDYLKPGVTAVFLGSSGVGKSSLVNTLAGEEIMAVNEIREDDSRGRHTTTHRQLIMLQSGTMIIDTPGMRELSMWDVSSGMGEAFADVEQYLGKCRFSDCRHNTEPGCAIRSAIESGELSSERWESWRKLNREAQFADDKASFLRNKQQWHKDIAQINRHRKAAKRGNDD